MLGGCALNQIKMKEFTLFWLNGESEIVKGSDASNAMTLAGYGVGAVRALDFYAQGDKRNEYAWNKGTRNWDSIKVAVS